MQASRTQERMVLAEGGVLDEWNLVPFTEIHYMGDAMTRRTLLLLRVALALASGRQPRPTT